MRPLTVNVPSGTQYTGEGFTVEFRPTTSGTKRIRVEVEWHQRALEPSPRGQYNVGLHITDFAAGSTTPQTIQLQPVNVSREYATTITFTSYELYNSPPIERCDTYLGETDADARADDRCWFYTRLWKGREHTQTEQVTVAPKYESVTPFDVKISRQPQSLSEGGATTYQLTIDKRLDPSKTYTVTPRLVARHGGLPAGLTVDGATSWTGGNKTVTINLSAAGHNDDDILDERFDIAHDLSGDFHWGRYSRSPARLVITTPIIDDDKVFQAIIKDADGNVIGGGNPLQLPARRYRDSRDDLYVTVELSARVQATVYLARGAGAPFTVSTDNFARSYISYHETSLRFTEDNWNQPRRVYLRTSGNASVGDTATLEVRILDGIRNPDFTPKPHPSPNSTRPVEFVNPTDIGLPQSPPVTEPESSGVPDGQSTNDELSADHPLVKYAALVTKIYNVYITDHNSDDVHNSRWKRVLKALGHAEYVGYSGTAMTSAEAQQLYDNNGWWRWKPIPAALADAESYVTPSSTEQEQEQEQEPEVVQAESPLVKYAALVTKIYNVYITDHNSDDVHNSRWKRVLKALGHAEYKAYAQSAMTSAEAQQIYDDNGWPRWREISAALRDAEDYSP